MVDTQQRDVCCHPSAPFTALPPPPMSCAVRFAACVARSCRRSPVAAAACHVISTNIRNQGCAEYLELGMAATAYRPILPAAHLCKSLHEAGKEGVRCYRLNRMKYNNSSAATMPPTMLSMRRLFLSAMT